LLALLTGGVQSVMWFLAYRDAERRHREAEEFLTRFAVSIQTGNVPKCAALAKMILKRAGLVVETNKKGT
jgi:hypothetical protein